MKTKIDMRPIQNDRKEQILQKIRSEHGDLKTLISDGYAGIAGDDDAENYSLRTFAQKALHHLNPLFEYGTQLDYMAIQALWSSYRTSIDMLEIEFIFDLRNRKNGYNGPWWCYRKIKSRGTLKVG